MKKTLTPWCIGLMLLAILFWLPVSSSAQQLAVGSGSFTLTEKTGVNETPLQAYYYRPAAWQDGRPIVVVFHGLKRNAQEYCEGWKDYAEKHDFLVVCPEFTESKYPGVRYYNTGNVTDSDDKGGKVQPRNAWVFPAIDRVINAAKKSVGAKKSRTIIFAHSAGAQIIHRYVLLNGRTAADRIIAANSGWYTMPNQEDVFPYGLRELPVTDKELQAAFQMPVTILLGEKDTVRSKVLRKTPEADAQGMNRLERGKKFYAEAQKEAKRLGTAFNWQLVTVPGVGHDGVGMAVGAVPLIEEMAR